MGPARFVSIYIGFYYISRGHIFMCLIYQLYRYQFMYSIFTLHSTFIQLGGPRAQEGVNGHNVTHPRPTLRASSRLTVILLVSFELYTSSSYILLSILCIRSRESRAIPRQSSRWKNTDRNSCFRRFQWGKTITKTYGHEAINPLTLS